MSTAQTPPAGAYAAPNSLRAILVDLDGTLLDTVPDLTLALNCMRAELGLKPVEEGMVTSLVGRGSAVLVQRALALDMAPAEVALHSAAALARYLAFYAEVNGERSSVYPGVVDGLAEFKTRGWPVACVTNKPYVLSVALLRRFELLDYMAAVVGGDSQPEMKPKPQPLFAACRQLGVTPSEAVMIGDSGNDAEAARAAGCPVLLVPYGYQHDAPLRGLDADGIVDSLRSAVGWIDAANRLRPSVRA